MQINENQIKIEILKRIYLQTFSELKKHRLGMWNSALVHWIRFNETSFGVGYL